MENVEGRAALQGESFALYWIAGDFLQDIEEPQHLLERAGLMTSIAGEALERLNRRRRHSQSLEPAFHDVEGENHIPTLSRPPLARLGPQRISSLTGRYRM
jgi:hypothetical protein